MLSAAEKTLEQELEVELTQLVHANENLRSIY